MRPQATAPAELVVTGAAAEGGVAGRLQLARGLECHVALRAADEVWERGDCDAVLGLPGLQPLQRLLADRAQELATGEAAGALPPYAVAMGGAVTCAQPCLSLL